jgi:hypothetical protein
MVLSGGAHRRSALVTAVGSSDFDLTPELTHNMSREMTAHKRRNALQLGEAEYIDEQRPSVASTILGVEIGSSTTACWYDSRQPRAT